MLLVSLVRVALALGHRDAMRGSFLHQLTDTWDDLAAVQLNVGHEGFVGQAAGAVLQVKARGTQRAQVGGDLLGQPFERAFKVE
jgi:hypothetical protein